MAKTARISSIDIPITKERVAKLRKELQALMVSWPESRARAKAQRKAALGILDELVSEIDIYEQKRFDELMSPSTRKQILHKIETRLKLE